MKNPLIRRIPRELKGDWHKYLVIIVFMVIMIGVISGMYVGHDSMLAAVYAGRDELNLEDGSFELSKKASQALLDDMIRHIFDCLIVGHHDHGAAKLVVALLNKGQYFF